MFNSIVLVEGCQVSTESINQVLKSSQLVSTGINKFNTTDTNCYEADHLFNQLTDLVNPQFRAWYCKRFYALGKDRVLILASQARADGRDPRKLFSTLIKNEGVVK
jgi:hypothetical protein